jgi:N-sulfoglucosamine sulfohydrolase
MNRRPNILFAIADDASHMGAYGHRFLNTPAFDRVAKEGVLFNRAFTTNPKCAPSRASILTGNHTWQLEDAGCHFGIFPSKFPVYPDLLDQSGYHVGFTGKGWAPGDYERGGFKHNPAGREYNACKLVPPAQTEISDKDYAANFVDFLEKRPEDSPFCFWYGGHEPHRHYNKGEGLRAGKTTEHIELPPYWPDDEIIKEDMVDYAYEIEWFDQHLASMIEKLKAIGEYENTLIVVTSDNGAPFPRVKGQMYEDDFRLPLAASWPAVIQPGRKIDDLVSFTDFAPTFLEAAGLEVPSTLPGKSLMGIFQSLEAGWVEPDRDHVFMGRERHDMGREGDRGYPVRCLRTKDYLYVRNFAPDRWPAGNPETNYTNCDGSPTKDLILERHQNEGEEYYYNLNFGKRPLEELYAVETDPACIKNLAGDPAFQSLKEEMWQQLQEGLEKHGDPRIFGNGDQFDHYEYVGDAPHSWAHYVAGTWEPQVY